MKNEWRARRGDKWVENGMERGGGSGGGGEGVQGTTGIPPRRKETEKQALCVLCVRHRTQ